MASNNITDYAENMPEFRLVSAYIQTIDYLVKQLQEESPYHLLTPNYRICLDKVREALFNFRVEYATQFKFQ